MREIHIKEITSTVKSLCIHANICLNPDIRQGLQQAMSEEPFPPAKDILHIIEKNAQVAQEEALPICQDTGMTVVFLEIGQDVHIVGGDLYTAIHQGVREGYEQGVLRKSVVKDPLRRENTQDNTPAVIHVKIVPGKALRINVVPKGFGSENMSRITMLKPADGVEGIKAFVIDTVRKAGPNACPPMVIGIGIGGTFEKAALLAKEALTLPIDQKNEDAYYDNLEKELMEAINATGVGPQGFGGKTTCLGVNIKAYPTHIAGLPVACNISCHATRHSEKIL
ncbi:MAG: fumarate hydratase [Clostridiales bacterium]|nr:fumarate hydratase [Clostridiales bacterium]